MDEFKGAVMQLLKTKQLEEKQFARLADVANLLKLVVEKINFLKTSRKFFSTLKKSDGLADYIICGCLGILRSTVVSSQFKNRAALYLKKNLSEDFVNQNQRRIFNYGKN